MDIQTYIPAKRKHWTAEEDAAICRLIDQFPDAKWTDISKRLGEWGISGRTGKQCRERWFNHLSPDISKDEWTSEELYTLFTIHKGLGNLWSMISSHLPGRSENAVKNQYYSLLRRQYRKFKGTEPSRKNLKKYDAVLSSQILCALNKKIRSKHGIKTPKFEKIVVIEDCERAEDLSEHSTLLDEVDLSCK